jgi:hypothetical protein
MTDLQPYKDKIHYDELDQNIVGLVRVMNEITTLTTVESCGGHQNPDAQARQAALGRWYITFHTADPYAIALIASTAEKFGPAVQIDVRYHSFGKGEGLDLINLMYAMQGATDILDSFAEFLTADLKSSPRGFWDL